MAETQSMLQQMGLTPGKAALVGVLAVVLLGVVYTKYLAPDRGGSPAPVAAATVAPPASLPTSVSPASTTKEPSDSSLESVLADFDETRWRPPQLTEVIAHDPFALPPAFPKPPQAVVDPALAAEGGDGSAAALKAEELAAAVEQMQRQLEELQQRGVHVIVGLRDEYVAMIGDRTVRVGDEINGFIVTAIEPDGVRVERKGLE